MQARIPRPNPNAANSRKGRLFAALGLGLGILDTALYLNQLIRDPGVVLVRTPYHLVFVTSYYKIDMSKKFPFNCSF